MKIKRLPLFVIPLLLTIANAHAQTPSRSETWQTYTVHGEDFSMSLPTLPSLHTNYEWLERIRGTRRIYGLGSYADGVVYVIYIYENPRPRQSLKEFLTEKVAVPLLDYKDVSLDGFSGKTLSNSENVVQFFSTEERIYRFEVMGAPVDDPRTTKFFLSLSLHKKKGSTEVDDGPGNPYEPPPVTPDSPIDATAKKLLTGKEVDRKPRLAMKPEPAYTESARQHSITGTVVLKVVFASNGSVTNMRTVSGLPYGLTDRAIDTARKIKFIPAVKDGKFVSMWMQLEYNFNLY